MNGHINRLLLKAFLNKKGVAPIRQEGYQSGQMGRAVNPLTSVFEGSNPSPSTIQNSSGNKNRSVSSMDVAGVVQW
tara:strand:- start:20 stop:247 length:228 start_codon:yes stop_codon:yes gene_type:complete